MLIPPKALDHYQNMTYQRIQKHSITVKLTGIKEAVLARLAVAP